jgi:DNA repair protein RadD
MHSNLPPLYKIPHDYQQKAIDSFFEYYKNSKNAGNPLITVPTGGGKSIINAEIIRTIYNLNSSVKILCLTHTQDIIGQNAVTLKTQAPHIQYGIYSAGLGQKCLDHTITFAGIQSIWDKHLHVGHVDLIMIDEAHLCPVNDNGRYREFIGNLKKINPNIRIFGLTATPWRLDNGWLTCGIDKIFDCIIYEISILELIGKGRLSTIITSKEVLTKADFSDLKINKMTNDYIPSTVSDAIYKIIGPAISECISLAKDRKSWIVFCPSLRILKQAEELLNFNGITTRSITSLSKGGKTARAAVIEDFKKGRFQALLNVDSLTTGFDAPNVDCMICLRPTQSSGLWVQMLGRAMRINPGKENALLLDYGGNLERHGPIDKIQPPYKSSRKKKKGEEEVTIKPVKVCPRCEQECSMTVQACPFCNYEYPIVKHIEERASQADVFSVKREPVLPNVNYMMKLRHKKQGMRDCVKIAYVCSNGKTYFDWLYPEHTSLAKNKTILYFYDIGLTSPNTVQELLDMDIPMPKSIRVDETGKYPVVLSRNYDNPAMAEENMMETSYRG